MEKTVHDDTASASDDSSQTIKKAAKNVLKHRTFRDGAIYLFVRADYKKPTWFCRIKVPGMKGYINCSTGTTDEHAAYKFADDRYNQALVRVIGGENPTAKRIKGALEAYKLHLLPNVARESIHNKRLLADRILPFLGPKSFDDLDTALLSQLFAYLARESRKGSLSPNTIRRLASDVKHFLNWCSDNGYITKLPKFPRATGDQSRRPHFDAKDWAKVTRQLREFVKIENKAVKRDRTMLVNYVLVLCNTGIRVGEARTLKWRDIREVGGEDGKAPDMVLTVTGKTGPREVVSSSSDIKTYLRRIYDLRIAELTTEDKPKPEIDVNGLVFAHKDGLAVGSFKKSFQSLLKAAKVEFDTYGQKRTIYSLRHTYATFRLHNGVDYYILAKNMGTSVAMLEQFYGHTSNVASAEELTKRGKRIKSGAASTLSWLEKAS